MELNGLQKNIVLGANMKTLEELKITIDLAREAYSEARKSIEPYRQAYKDALAAHDAALDDALEEAYVKKEESLNSKSVYN